MASECIELLCKEYELKTPIVWLKASDISQNQTGRKHDDRSKNTKSVNNEEEEYQAKKISPESEDTATLTCCEFYSAKYKDHDERNGPIIHTSSQCHQLDTRKLSDENTDSITVEDSTFNLNGSTSSDVKNFCYSTDLKKIEAYSADSLKLLDVDSDVVLTTKKFSSEDASMSVDFNDERQNSSEDKSVVRSEQMKNSSNCSIDHADVSDLDRNTSSIDLTLTASQFSLETLDCDGHQRVIGEDIDRASKDTHSDWNEIPIELEISGADAINNLVLMHPTVHIINVEARKAKFFEHFNMKIVKPSIISDREL